MSAGRLWMSCAIFCRRKDTGSYYTPRLDLNDMGVNAYFPDGTWCHSDSSGSYYCQQRHCLPEARSSWLSALGRLNFDLHALVGSISREHQCPLTSLLSLHRASRSASCRTGSRRRMTCQCLRTPCPARPRCRPCCSATWGWGRTAGRCWTSCPPARPRPRQTTRGRTGTTWSCLWGPPCDAKPSCNTNLLQGHLFVAA